MLKQRTQLSKRNRKILLIKIPEYILKPLEANAALIYPMALLLKAAAAAGATAWAASKVNPETTKSVVDKAASYVQAAPVAIYNTYRTFTKPTGLRRVNNTAVQSGLVVTNDATAVQRPTIAYTRPHSTAIKMSDIGVLLNRDEKVNTDAKPEEKKLEEGTLLGEQITLQKPELSKKGRWLRAKEWAGNKIAGNTKSTTKAATENPKDPEQWSTFTKLLWENQANNFGRILGTGYKVRNIGRVLGGWYGLGKVGGLLDKPKSFALYGITGQSENPTLKLLLDSIDIYKKLLELYNLKNGVSDSTNVLKGDTDVVNPKPNSNVEVTLPTETLNLGNPMRGTLH